MDDFRTPGPIDHPAPAQTYGGFAAQGPAESAGLDAPRETPPPTYAGLPVRPDTARRSASPRNLGWTGVVLVAFAALLGVVVTQSRWSMPAPPARDTAPQGAAAKKTVPPPPVVRVDTARVATAIPAPAPAPAPTRAPTPAPTLTRGDEPAPPVARRAAETKAAASRCGRDGACPDKRFAALDRQVNAAFAAAMRSSAEPGPLGQDQQNWIIRLDRVRRKDPGAAEDLYRARVAELRALASKDSEPAHVPLSQTDLESHN
jgi:hypothetical protein